MTLDYKILGQLYYGPELEYVPGTPGTPGTPEIPPTGYYTTMVPTPVRKFYGFPYNNDSFISSTNGINWTKHTFPVASEWTKPILFKNRIILLNVWNQTTLYSSDGETWTFSTIPQKSGSLFGIANSPERIVVQMGNVYQQPVSFLTSEDGINWTSYIAPVQYNWTNGAYGNGAFVFINNQNSTIITSTNGLDWVSVDIGNFGPIGLYFLNNKFIIATNDMMYYTVTSTDGLNWTQGSSTPYYAQSNNLFYLNNKYYYIDNNSSTSYSISEDGTTWQNYSFPTSYYNRTMSYGNGKFVVMGRAEEPFLTSNDGIEWQSHEPAISNEPYSYLIRYLEFITLDTLVETQINIGGQDGTPGTPGTPGYFNEIANPQLLYTVPQGKQTTVTAIYTANNDTVERTYDLAVVPSGETLSVKHHVKWDAIANVNDFNLTDIKITLSAGDSIYVFPSTFNKVGFTAFGIEIS